MKSELISVIVPNYNNDKYLEECLESILKQTYKNIEIVVIDDASTDNSRNILNRYSNNYDFIKVIYNEKNQGVTKNRDYAIFVSNGEFITTLDSDDYYIDNHKLEKEIDLIVKYKKEFRKDIIAYSNIILVNEKGKPLFPNAKNVIKEGSIFKDLFARECMIPRDFVFTKKQYFSVGGFDVNIPIYEDWDLKLRLAYENEFYYTYVDGIGYRRHGSGLSSASSSKHLKWIKYIYNKNKKLIKNTDRNYIEYSLNKFMTKAFNRSLKFKINETIKRFIRKIK